MKQAIISAFILFLFQITSGQGKYLTNEGVITFYSHTLIEDITAVNEKVAAVIDLESRELAIIVVMKEFQFEKKLMQEHFNENYAESDTYPRATFSGRISGLGEVDFQRPGEYRVRLEGDMTIHGITRKLRTEGTIEVRLKGIVAHTKFLLNPEDYGIKIPGVVRNNIAEKMEITATLFLDPV